MTVAILFTGSRTTLICSIVFIIARSYRNKKIDNKNQILNIIISLIVYVIIDKSVILAMLTLPIIMYISSLIYKIKIKMRYIGIIFVISTGCLFLFSTNTFDRIKNISLDNGSLQERIILFQDATIAIKNKPFGYGINSYENEVSEIGTAFFEVRYVHNSLLQTGFEIGVLGIVFMMCLFVYGGILVYKNKKLSYHLVIYIY